MVSTPARFFALALFLAGLITAAPLIAEEQGEVLVSQETYWTFRGTLSFEHSDMTLCGLGDVDELRDEVIARGGVVEDQIILEDPEELIELLDSGFCTIAPADPSSLSALTAFIQVIAETESRSDRPKDVARARLHVLTRRAEAGPEVSNRMLSNYENGLNMASYGPRLMNLGPRRSEQETEAYRAAYRKCSFGGGVSEAYYDCACLAEGAAEPAACLSALFLADRRSNFFQFLVLRMPLDEALGRAECGARLALEEARRKPPQTTGDIEKISSKALRQAMRQTCAGDF